MSEEHRQIRFFLHRLVLEPLNKEQKSINLFEIFLPKAELLKKLLLLKPEAQISDNSRYIAAGTKAIDNDTLFFKFGRFQKKKGTDFDTEERDFINITTEDKNYALCLYSVSKQVLAIEKKSDLPQPHTLANHLAKVLNSVKEDDLYIKEFNAQEIALLNTSICKAKPIIEPSEFIKKITTAASVKSFTVYLAPPNPRDFNDMIKAPLDDLMDDTGATSSSVSVRNNDGLEKERIASLSREAAAYGTDATARIQEDLNLAAKTIHMKSKESRASVDVEMPHSILMVHFINAAKGFMEKIISKFNDIHNGN